jgi:hypothetical protein
VRFKSLARATELGGEVAKYRVRGYGQLQKVQQLTILAVYQVCLMSGRDDSIVDGLMSGGRRRLVGSWRRSRQEQIAALVVTVGEKRQAR